MTTKQRAGNCYKCGTPLRAVRVTYEFDVGDTEFAADIPGFLCPNCGEELSDGAAMVKRELEAAVLLTSYKPFPQAIGFCRGAIGLRAKEFAELVGVAPETVSRWENGVREIDAAAWGLLCNMVLDASAGNTTTLDRLRANAEVRDRPVPRKRLTLKPA